MKIHRSIRDIHSDQWALNQSLKSRVDVVIGKLKNTNWHYESRLKSEESFAVKIEAGLVQKPDALEDFLACVVVVPGLDDITEAERRLESLFQVIQRRPHSDKATTKQSSDFPFDDVRLYVSFLPDDTLPPNATDDIIFEIQIRTFLQHAWSVSTHDVVYKTDAVHWARERVAHQIKAMLESAEVTVSTLSSVEATKYFPESYPPYDELNAAIAVLRANWEEPDLPLDLKRLASGVLRLLEVTGDSGPIYLENLLERGRTRYEGHHNSDWSPYRAVLEYLIDEEPMSVATAISDEARTRRMFVYAESIQRLQLEPEAVPLATTVILR